MAEAYVYIAECRDHSYYTGWTNNLEKRMQTHNAGKGARYTKSRRPVHLVYAEAFDSKIAAMQREYAIKQLSHKEKAELISAFDYSDFARKAGILPESDPQADACPQL